MNRRTLRAAIAEAERFLTAATDLLENGNGGIYDPTARRVIPAAWQGGGDDPKRSGRVRRASMDLTRVLAELRKP